MGPGWICSVFFTVCALERGAEMKGKVEKSTQTRTPPPRPEEKGVASSNG